MGNANYYSDGCTCDFKTQCCLYQKVLALKTPSTTQETYRNANKGVKGYSE